MKLSTELSTIEEDDRAVLADFMLKYRDRFMESVSSYAYGRWELQLKYWVSLSKGHARASTPYFLRQFNSEDISRVYGVLSKVYGGDHWDSALCLWYMSDSNTIPNTIPVMHYHRDHTAYERGAITINLIGRVVFSIKPNYCDDSICRYLIRQGEVIKFDNKVPHKIDVLSQERAAIALFRVKPEFKLKPSKGKQLSLF